MQNQKMDRGTDALQAHMNSTQEMSMRQTRRGWLAEIFGCEAKTEMKYNIAGNQVAHSLEDSECICRYCCAPCYPFQATIKELNTEAELLSVDRPFKCAPGGCKCCCYQEISITSGGQPLGGARETYYYCVPSFMIFDATGQDVYLVHPPTCCGGCCVNCCTEGNPCGKGCCKVPFWIFDANDTNTGGSNANKLGKILKTPKSLMTELFTDAHAFDMTFPEGATADQKGLIVGSSLLLNAAFFEGEGASLMV